MNFPPRRQVAFWSTAAFLSGLIVVSAVWLAMPSPRLHAPFAAQPRGAAAVNPVATQAVPDGLPEESASDVATELKAHREALRALQEQVRRMSAGGHAEAKDLAALLARIREEQSECLRLQALSGKPQRQVAAARSSPDPAQAAARSAAALNKLPPGQKALLTARSDLAKQMHELQVQNPGDSRALVDAVTQWQQTHADLLAQADKEARSAPLTVEQLQAQSARTAFASPAHPHSLQPETDVLLRARRAAARDLQISLLQNADASPEEKRAALQKWQADHAQQLEQATVDAQAAADARERGRDARTKAVPSNPTEPPQ